ncbi:alpha/beta-type small acid-soluble spore protein [Alkaliphilus serpentinus]|nr:alpha/beta-type small acid-soluble spore protein [Alkaliphilus serpentinus]
MAKIPVDPNAMRALQDLKIEIANEIGVANELNNKHDIHNVFRGGKVGGNMTKRMIEMAERSLTNGKE